MATNQVFKINNNAFVSIEELNKVIKFSINNEYNDFEIYFKNSIQKIDIVFIAGLILFYLKYKTKYLLRYDGGPFERIFEIRQYFKQLQELYGINWSDVFLYFHGIQQLSDSDYLAAESFAPIFLINQDTVNDLFIEKEKNKLEKGLLNIYTKYLNDKLKGRNKSEIEYLTSDVSVKKELIKYSSIHTFIFTVLYNKISPFVKTKEKNIENPTKRTEELWAFSKEFVKGLHELAKNIVEHSSMRVGMITMRVYDEDEYRLSDSGSIDKVLESYVFDFGEVGIIQKLTDDTKNNLSLNQIFSDDLYILTQSFKLRDFIKPTITKKLQQQLYRELAHYGLMKFYKLIEDNQGVVVSSSKGSDDNRDIYYSNEGFNEKSMVIGTSYYIQLPFKYELFKLKDQTKLYVDMQGTPQTIDGLSELMNWKVLRGEEDLVKSGKSRKKLFFDYTVNIVIQNRSDELKLFSFFTKFQTQKEVFYIAINFMNVQLSSSSLLRFLAHLSTKYEQSIIIYNLDYKLYEEMIEDNSLLLKLLIGSEQEIPFWYKDRGILIYSIHKDLNFSFADVLFGINEQEFCTINEIVSHTFPNTNSIIRESSQMIEGFQLPICMQPYFYQVSLLPFDLILLCNKNLTLFQSNLEFLLSKELTVNESNKLS